MLCSIKQLGGYAVAAQDGEVGKVAHAYFDDRLWTIRHLVAGTGTWLSGRDVLISPHAVQRIDEERRQVAVNLTRRQVEQAPDIDTDKPVSRQQEARYYDYYGYPYYWGGAGLWGPAAFPMGAGAVVAMASTEGTSTLPPDRQTQDRGEQGDPHLRSSAEVTGYAVEARDGGIGHVEDILFDPQSWAIRHVVIDTRNWLPGRKVLVEPAAIEDVDWSGRQVRVNLTREAVKASPEYRPGELLAA